MSHFNADLASISRPRIASISAGRPAHRQTRDRRAPDRGRGRRSAWSAPALAAEFGISERTFHRIFADRETTFERHLLRLRAGLFRNLLRQDSLASIPIARLAHQCGFADAAHATRRFGVTPRDFRKGQPAGP
jgi:AraC-like DNA-binding protein